MAKAIKTAQPTSQEASLGPGSGKRKAEIRTIASFGLVLKKWPNKLLAMLRLIVVFFGDIRRYFAAKKAKFTFRPHKKSAGRKKGPFKQRLQPIYGSSQFGPVVIIILAILGSIVFNVASARHTGHPKGLSVLSSATSAATPVTVWCEACRVTSITIPSILFSDTNVGEVNFDEKQKTWPTPVSGIATPAETVTNNAIVFGHSLWFGKVSDFSRISGLKIGDKIYVSDQFGGNYVFVVTKLELDDRMDGDAVHAKPSQQLTLLTSARYNGQWLLPTQVDPTMVDNVQDPSKYAIFVVTANPQ